MLLAKFKQLIRTEFGDDLSHATPANVRGFVDRLETEFTPRKPGERYVINEQCNTYEEVIKDFFSRVLEMPQEDAFIRLYTLALDLTFSGIEMHDADRFSSLFRDIDEPGD